MGWGGHCDGCFLVGLAGHPSPDHKAFPYAWAVPFSLCMAGHLPDVQEDVTLPFPLCCREKDIEMFLESSRSKFIGYTLGRWVQSQPSAATGGGLWERPVWGLLLSLHGSREGFGWLLHGFIPGWSLPHPWVLSPALSLTLSLLQ